MRGQQLSAHLFKKLFIALLLSAVLAACSQVRDVGSVSLDPIKDFLVTPVAGDAPLVVTATWQLDTSASRCQVSFGDGSAAHVPTACEQGSLDHTFSTPGVYKVILEADSGGKTFERMVTVNVTDPANPNQNHSPTISSFVSTPASGTAPLPVVLQWVVADPDGDVLTCRLVTGDGTAPGEVADCANNSTFAHTFQLPGTYNVQLIVSDGNGGSVSRSVTVTATDAGGGVPSNEDPVISGLTVTPPEGVAPLTTTIAWDITDPDGDTLSCLVDFGDGNSQTVDPCAGTGDVQYTYTTPGHYTISLTVSDGKGGSATRNGSASVTVLPAVLLSTGTSLLSVDSEDSQVLDAIVSGLIGTPITADVVGWDSLVGADVPALDLLAELETILGVTGLDDVLSANLTFDQLLQAIEAVLAGLPIASELADLRNEALGLAGTISFDALFDLSTIGGAELTAVLAATDLNIFDLVFASLQLHAYVHADPTSPLQVALPTDVTLTTVNAVSATVSVTSPPQLLLAREGATFNSAGLRLLLDIDLLSLDTPLTGPVIDTLEVLLSVPLLALVGYLDADVGLTDLELYLDFAPASGTVVEIGAAPDSVKLNLVPGVVEARLGQLSIADRGAYFAGAALSSLTFEPATIGAVDLTVRNLLTNAEIGSVALNIGAVSTATTSGSSPADVSINAFPGFAVHGASATTVAELAQSLLGSTDLSITVGTSVGPIGTLVSALTGLLSDLLGALTGSLADLVANLPLADVLRTVVEPALDGLGVGLGEINVIGRQLVAP